MKLESKPQYTRKYKSFTDDFIDSGNQEFKLNENYKWVNNKWVFQVVSSFLYYFMRFIGLIYCSLVFNLKIVNKKIIKKYTNKGFFVYGNHTQAFGDVVIPALVCKHKRIYTIASTANYGIPVIGKLLPMLGALPVPGDFGQMKSFTAAIKQRIEEGHPVIIYPEAHLWPYSTIIRPFKVSSFHFPIDLNVPAFALTVTYRRRRFSKRPAIRVYVDGPFFQDNSLGKKDRCMRLRDEIYETMVRRSCENNCEYIRYEEDKGL